VLEVAGRAQSLTQLRTETLAALEEHLGYRGSSFLIGEFGGAKTAGSVHGRPAALIEEYLERWSEHDVFESARAHRELLRRRAVSLTDIYPHLEPPRRRYAEEFLRPQRVDSTVAIWLDTGRPLHGFISVLGYGKQDFDGLDRQRLLALAPHLANLVRIHLPPTTETPFAGQLSPRQTAVAELVAEGCSNREIARRLRVTDGTVKKHVSASLRALGLQRRTQLAIAWQTAATSTQTHQPTPARKITTTHT
jgi:DNA-binding CsgD family transcriptional regulator